MSTSGSLAVCRDRRPAPAAAGSVPGCSVRLRAQHGVARGVYLGEYLNLGLVRWRLHEGEDQGEGQDNGERPHDYPFPVVEDVYVLSWFQISPPVLLAGNLNNAKTFGIISQRPK